MKKYIFFVIWIVLLLLVPATILRITPLAAGVRNPGAIFDFLQRFIGLALFVFLFVQVILGIFMDKLTKKIGGWIFKFYIAEEILIFALVFLHPLMFMLVNHFAAGGWDPYSAFINACFLCQTPTGYYLTLGIVSLWTVAFAIFAAFFAYVDGWFKKNRRKLHVLNYAVFLLIGVHAFFLGLDFKVQPFYSFAILAYVFIAGRTIFVEIPGLYKNFRNWIKN
jgi:hypothetical protein